MQEYEFYEIGLIIFPCVSPLHPILLKMTLTHQIIYGFIYLLLICNLLRNVSLCVTTLHNNIQHGDIITLLSN